MEGQLSFADCFGTPYKITKPIRLIELFAGYGSQAMALRNIGANFERWKVVEFDKYAISSYNAIHGTDFHVMDIRDVHGSDLEVVDRCEYCYVLFYSFPCTDLSVAGAMKGMEEGSGTRSALLWEVKRLIDELGQELPQILIMENVPQVRSKKNAESFGRWLDFLNSKGYSSFVQNMNAKDYGVAQSRNRTFVVSILGDYTYTFPQPVELQKRMVDYLEDEVDEKYYFKNDKAKNLIDKLIEEGKILTDRQTDRQTDRRLICPSLTQQPSTSQTQLQADTMQELSGTRTSTLECAYIIGLETSYMPKTRTVSNAIMAREDRGISRIGGQGNGAAIVTEPTRQRI